MSRQVTHQARTNGRLLGDWVFRNPAAERIAADLSPELLALRTRRLVADVRCKYAVSYRTALRAVSMARHRA